MLEVFDEADRTRGSLTVEVPATIEGILQIGEVPPDGKAHIFADREFAVADVIGVLFGGVQFHNSR